MSYLVFIIHTNGSVTKVAEPAIPELNKLQSWVGGYLEPIPLFNSFIYDGKRYTNGLAFCNEDGLLRGHTPNEYATRAWKAAAPETNPQYLRLVGDVVIYFKEKENGA